MNSDDIKWNFCLLRKLESGKLSLPRPFCLSQKTFNQLLAFLATPWFTSLYLVALYCFVLFCCKLKESDVVAWLVIASCQASSKTREKRNCSMASKKIFNSSRLSKQATAKIKSCQSSLSKVVLQVYEVKLGLWRKDWLVWQLFFLFLFFFFFFFSFTVG